MNHPVPLSSSPVRSFFPLPIFPPSHLPFLLTSYCFSPFPSTRFPAVSSSILPIFQPSPLAPLLLSSCFPLLPPRRQRAEIEGTFHRITVPSQPPLANSPPSGLNAILLPQFALSAILSRYSLVTTSCNRTAPSALPLAIVLLSALNAKLVTKSVCPAKMCRCSPVLASHSRISLRLALTSKLPSGLNAIP